MTAVTYDIALASSSNYLAARIGELCAQLGLAYFLVEPVWVEDFVRKLHYWDGLRRQGPLVPGGVSRAPGSPTNLRFEMLIEWRR